MGLFRRFIEKFFTRFSFVKFVVIVVLFLLCFFAIKSNVYAVEDYSTCWNSATYNDNYFRYYLPQNVIECFQTLDEYTSGNYDYIWWYDGARYNAYFWDKTNSFKLYNTINESINRYNYFFHSGNQTNFECRYYNIYLNIKPPQQDSYTIKHINDLSNSSYKDTDNKVAYFYTNKDIYINQNIDDVFLTGVSSFVSPYIVNDSSISSWSFDSLIINLGSVSHLDTEGHVNNFTLTTTYISDMFNFDFDISCEPYLDTVNNTIIIPRYLILNNFIVEDFDVSFELFVRGFGVIDSYELGEFSITLTTAQVNEINGQNALDKEEENAKLIASSIEQSNNYLNELTSTDIDNTIIEDFFLDNGGGTDTDSTGVESFFMILYNAFCTNETINVTFTLPFVNKSVTISSAEISSHYPQALKSLVSTIAWGGIALFICKDIRKMIDKMQEGNIENVSRNVEREVL